MTYSLAFHWIVTFVAVELLLLTHISKKHSEALLLHGASLVHQSGVGIANIVLRLSWLAAMLLETHFWPKQILPGLFWTSLASSILALGLRLAAMQALGPRWTLPTIVVPGQAPVRHGIYRYLTHPNWLGVALEIFFIPMLAQAYISAAFFLLLELLLLKHRAKLEQAALNTTRHPRQSVIHQKVAIIGAGAAGLAMARELSRYQIPFEIFEQQQELGGLWSNAEGSPLYQNTHLISPKSVQAFDELAMPDDYPDFPHHRLVHAYLKNYAEHFNLRPAIRFGYKLQHMQRQENHWQLTFENGQQLRYADVILASGYHDKVKMPLHPGNFDGEIKHSKSFQGPAELIGKRVLVVGSGQSAMDILSEAAVCATQVLHSTRHHFVCAPRYLLGQPFEEMQDHPPPVLGKILQGMALPTMFRFVALLSGLAMRFNGLSHKKLGLAGPSMKTAAVLPTMDQKVYALYAQGDIQHKPEVSRLDGKYVQFSDDMRAEVDLIIYATGYQVDCPYLSREQLNWPASSTIPKFFAHIFHPEQHNLFAIGMVHPIGSHWPVFSAQARLIARYLQAREQGVADAFSRILMSSDEHIVNRHLGSGLMVSKHRYIRQIDQLTLTLIQQSAQAAKSDATATIQTVSA